MHDLRTVLTCMSSLLQMIPPNSVLIMLIAMKSDVISITFSSLCSSIFNEHFLIFLKFYSILKLYINDTFLLITTVKFFMIITLYV